MFDVYFVIKDKNGGDLGLKFVLAESIVPSSNAFNITEIKCVHSIFKSKLGCDSKLVLRKVIFCYLFILIV